MYFEYYMFFEALDWFTLLRIILPQMTINGKIQGVVFCLRRRFLWIMNKY